MNFAYFWGLAEAPDKPSFIIFFKAYIKIRIWERSVGMWPYKNPNILVVDDEKSVRELICINLKANGFEVFAAEGGRQAIAIATDPAVKIDILITDIIMPHMNGQELANRICLLKPSIKVLFISAYSAEILSSHNLCPDGADYIKKPFRIEYLLGKISRVWTTSPRWKELVSR